MPEHAFLAALLKMAAEERQRAAQDEVMADDVRKWRTPLRHLADDFEAKANEHHGRAEVYEAFAHRLIGDIAGEMLLKQVEREFPPLSGAAEIPFEFEPDLVPRPWLLDYYRVYLPPLSPKSLIITSTN